MYPCLIKATRARANASTLDLGRFSGGSLAIEWACEKSVTFCDGVLGSWSAVFGNGHRSMIRAGGQIGSSMTSAASMMVKEKEGR
jgi:hypothetical protein